MHAQPTVTLDLGSTFGGILVNGLRLALFYLSAGFADLAATLVFRSSLQCFTRRAWFASPKNASPVLETL